MEEQGNCPFWSLKCSNTSGIIVYCAMSAHRWQLAAVCKKFQQAWRSECSIVADMNSSVLGFRTLQRHGYQVFSGIEPHLINNSLPVDMDI